MSELDRLGQLVEIGDLDAALALYAAEGRRITAEHRRRADPNEDYYRSPYNKLIGKRLLEGDGTAHRAVERLISSSVLLNEVDQDGFTPLGLLAWAGQLPLVELALKNGAKPNVGEYPALTAAVFSSDLPSSWHDVADTLVRSGANVNGLPAAMPPLYPAIQANHLDVIRYLVSVGADVNKIHDLPGWGKFSGTTLHWATRAAYTDHTDADTTSLLVDLGADPTIRNREGECPYDSVYDREHQDAESLQPILAFLSSKDEWRKASWKLTEGSRSTSQPKRKQQSRTPHVWEGVDFREGDRVRVFRRYNGFYRPPEDTGYSKPVIALPGLTATIHRFVPDGNHWWMFVRFDPGEWEEAENFGKRVRLGSFVSRFDPAMVNHIPPETSSGGGLLRFIGLGR